jgi:peptidoglycan/xylan/chitin deacetylase (PgdA/CDA1 family)
MTILCYHAVDPHWRSSLAVRPEAFARQCAALKRARRVLDLPEAMTRLGSSGRLPQGMAVLTFDDGFASLYDHAFPVLMRHRLPATVFLVAATLTPQGHPVDWIIPAPAQPPATLHLDQVLEMQQAGVRFASHSYAHRDLDALDEADCVRDLRDSRELLSDLLGRPVPFLAYPRGRHNPRVRRAAVRAGYTHAFTLPEAREARGPYAVPRVGIYPDDGPRAFQLKTARWYLPLRLSPLFPLLTRLARRRPSGRPDATSQPGA